MTEEEQAEQILLACGGGKFRCPGCKRWLRDAWGFDEIRAGAVYHSIFCSHDCWENHERRKEQDNWARVKNPVPIQQVQEGS